MCRHLCYLGEPITLSELVLDPVHSLAVQSYAPADMRGGGRINADGFGVGWFAATGQATRYRRGGPIWQDEGFAELAPSISAGSVLAAVRNATIGMPVTAPAAAPFTDGRWLFSLNGRVDGWPDTAVGLAEELPRRELLMLDAATDAALLWACLRHRLAAQAADPRRVLTGLVREVLTAAPASRLNLLLTDGERCYATTCTHALSWRPVTGGVVVASEPYDEHPGWQAVADNRLLVADRDGVSITELVPDGVLTAG